ncbi:hypothetical protein TNCV_2821211 [Trichonephila clavipes]|nr:hypothetical protein TNCV_2821211 [Trichonephila clavipes]
MVSTPTAPPDESSDVEKAFDRVWHNGLLFKLIQINLPPYLIKIIYEYLSNRTFQVKINSIHSQELEASRPELLKEVSYLHSFTASTHTTSPPLQRWKFVCLPTMLPFFSSTLPGNCQEKFTILLNR